MTATEKSYEGRSGPNPSVPLTSRESAALEDEEHGFGETEGEERDVVDKAARDAHDEVVAAETKARAGEAATIAEGYSDATSASEEATRTRDRLDQLETGTTRLQNLIDETFAKKSSAEAARFDEVQRQIQSLRLAM